MKKCVKCQIVYHSESRLYCLYCDTRLVSASVYDGFRTDQERSGKPFSARRQEVIDHERLEYLMGCYFQVRSFSFLYGLSRQEFKYGKNYKRPLVQPLNFASCMKVPWVFVDLLDSLFFRIFYKGYCPECQCKFIPVSGKMGHTAEECEFNKEYAAVLDNIRNGKIIVNESLFQQEAQKKLARGKKSAYHQLCSRKSGTQAFMDIMAILASMLLVIYIVVRLVMPLMGILYNF